MQIQFNLSNRPVLVEAINRYTIGRLHSECPGVHLPENWLFWYPPGAQRSTLFSPFNSPQLQLNDFNLFVPYPLLFTAFGVCISSFEIRRLSIFGPPRATLKLRFPNDFSVRSSHWPVSSANTSTIIPAPSMIRFLSVKFRQTDHLLFCSPVDKRSSRTVNLPVDLRQRFSIFKCISNTSYVQSLLNFCSLRTPNVYF